MTYKPDWHQLGPVWPNRQASRFITVAGLRWHTQIMGEGPDLLLLHGTGAATHSWRNLMPLLATQWRVIAVDLPGHGFTDTPAVQDLCFKGMREHMAALIAHEDWQPAAIIGHSAGAALAVGLADRLPRAPAHLVLTAPALFPFQGRAAPFFSLMARAVAAAPMLPALAAFRARDIAAVRRMVMRTGSHLGPEGYRHYALLLRHSGHIAATLAMMANWDIAGLAPLMHRLETPVLLLAGTRDAAIPRQDIDRAQALIPRVSRHDLPAGHLLHEEKPVQVAEIIKAYLSQS